MTGVAVDANSDAPGLYIHVPFCSTICPYCDFAVLTGDRSRRRRFVEDLPRELEMVGGLEWGTFDTVYFGGGTPSLLEGRDFEALLHSAGQSLHIHPAAWISLEANPEDVTAENIAAWRGLEVRFLSLGVQSFAAGSLAFLGRRHDADLSRESVELARAAGFETLSLDLIYGLPGQSQAAWRQELETAVAYEPDHLSCYQLTVHRRTRFGQLRRRGALVEMPDAEQGRLFRFTHRFLADAGYAGYEVSNFARAPEHRSRHNEKYWRHAPYLGCGPSAHSYVGRRRWWNEAKLARWQELVDQGERPVAASEDLDPSQLALERLMLGLRTAEGVDLEAVEQECEVAVREPNRRVLGRMVDERVAAWDGVRLVPTLEGLAIADHLAASLEIVD